MVQQKNKIIGFGLGIIGVVMVILGITSGVALPPLLSGIGFLLVAWHIL